MRLSSVLLIFLIIFPAVAILQYIILSPHLLYGFADIDWAGLLKYKYIENPFSIGSFMNLWNLSGVYATQYYFIGIQESLFSLDYTKFNLVAYVLKFLSTITIFPLFYIITKRKLIAILGTLIYTISFTTVAALYTVMTTINYLGIAFMNTFLLVYWQLAEKNKLEWRLMLPAIFFFYSAFFFATERMYPLVPLIIIGEFFYIYGQKFSKTYLIMGLKRLLLLFAPAIFLMLIKPNIRSEMIPFFVGNSMALFQKISDGNWHLIFTPFTALGSMFLPKEHQLSLGEINLTSLPDYLGFLLGGPLFIFGSVTLISAIFLSSKPRRFLLMAFAFITPLMIFSFYLATRRLTVNPDLRMYFDPNFVMPKALIGIFVFALTFAFLFEWTAKKMNNHFTLPLFMGPAMAFFFIIITWLPADIALVFWGIHRYLTIPAIGISLFLATVIASIYDKLRNIRITKTIAFTIFLILIPIYIIYTQAIANYFDYELNFAGTKASEHIRMKGKLKSIINNLSMSDPSVFFFDESQDAANSYFNETTVLAGFVFWTMFRDDEVVPIQFTPKLIRSYFLCGGNGIFCPEELKKAVVEKDGYRGLLFDGTFYKAENFYAFRFVNRDLVNITDELKLTLNLN